MLILPSWTPRVNEKTCGGMHENKVEDLTETLVEIFEQFKMNKKPTYF
jgi:hypothetical protein